MRDTFGDGIIEGAFVDDVEFTSCDAALPGDRVTNRSDNPNSIVANS